MTAPAAAPRRYRVLPVYLLLDTTVPGAGGAGAGGAAVVGVLPAVRDAWARHPALSDTLRLAVVDLAADAQVRLALGDPLTPGLAFPVLPVRYGVPTGGAVAAVGSTIESDVRGLDAEGLDARRPLLWIVLGTAPDDSWRAALDGLAASPARPVVVLCGFGGAASAGEGADARSVFGAGSATSYLADPGAPPAVAVAALTEVLTTTLVSTGHAAGADGSVLFPADDELPGTVHRVATTTAEPPSS